MDFDKNEKDVTVMFTGPRPKMLAGYDKEHYQQFVDDVSKYILELYDLGYLRFITGGAQGFDQLVFWAVDKAKRIHSEIQNICYIPYQDYGNKRMKYGLFSQYEFAQMIHLADDVRYTSMTFSNNALFKRNKAMCDDASLCVALYPDDRWRTDGNSIASCMQYACKRGMKMQQIQYAKVNHQLQFLGVV